MLNESYPWTEDQIVHMPKLVSWQRAMKYGLLEVGISPDNGFTYDHVYGTKVGGTTFDKYHTAAELLQSATHENIDVLIHATVQKVGCPSAATLFKNFSVLLLERVEVPFTNRKLEMYHFFKIFIFL